VLLFFLVLLCPSLLSLSGPSSISLSGAGDGSDNGHTILWFFTSFFLFCVCVLGTNAKLGMLAFCSFLFLVCAFGPPSLGTPGLFPFVLPSIFVLWSLSIYSLSIPLFYFSSSLFSEKEQGKQFAILVRPLSLFSAVRGFFSPVLPLFRLCSSPARSCVLLCFFCVRLLGSPLF